MTSRITDTPNSRHIPLNASICAKPWVSPVHNRGVELELAHVFFAYSSRVPRTQNSKKQKSYFSRNVNIVFKPYIKTFLGASAFGGRCLTGFASLRASLRSHPPTAAFQPPCAFKATMNMFIVPLVHLGISPDF